MTVELDKLTLAKGSHHDCEAGMCLFEAFNVLTQSKHTDECPPDVSQVLHTFGLQLNDCLPDDRRQDLKEFLPTAGKPSLLSGTHDDGLDEARSYMALDWLVRTYTSAWLDLAGLSESATELRGLRRIADMVAAERAWPVVEAARDKSAAVGAAARDAVGAAARDAAWAAAGGAAWAAAGGAAGDAAWDAAWDAAGDAAWAAARDAAWAAAWAAAGDALQPTIDQLQTSAIDLFRSMVRPEVAS